jgi:hypothetical protein
MNFDFNKGIIAKAKHTPANYTRCKATIKYIDSTFFVIWHKLLLPVLPECLGISTAKVVYSLPHNTEHSAWTPKGLSKILDAPKEVSKWWSKYRHNEIVYGIIIKLDNKEYFKINDDE